LALSSLFGVSAQTLSEFYVVTTSKARVALPPEETDQWIEFLSSLPFQPIDREIVARGIDLSRQYGVRYFDAALLAAAERLGAPIFYSEDLNHGQLYGPVRVLNPFLDS
jgi:predicted nucleic acid-binding protein